LAAAGYYLIFGLQFDGKLKKRPLSRFTNSSHKGEEIKVR
jgi:hypothetical protein